MSLASALGLASKLVDLIGRVLPKRKPKPPKYPTIKPVPVKRPMDPHEEKRR